MFQPKILANAVTTVWLIGYGICTLLAYIAPDLIFGVASAWFHAINIDVVRASMTMPLTSLLFGFVSFGTVVWLGTFTVGSLYNRWTKGTKE